MHYAKFTLWTPKGLAKTLIVHLLFGNISSVGIVKTTLCVSSPFDFRLEFLKPFHIWKNLENVGLRFSSSLEFKLDCDVYPTSIFELLLRLANRSAKVDSSCWERLNFSCRRALEIGVKLIRFAKLKWSKIIHLRFKIHKQVQWRQSSVKYTCTRCCFQSWTAGIA